MNPRFARSLVVFMLSLVGFGLTALIGLVVWRTEPMYVVLALIFGILAAMSFVAAQEEYL